MRQTQMKRIETNRSREVGRPRYETEFENLHLPAACCLCSGCRSAATTASDDVLPSTPRRRSLIFRLGKADLVVLTAIRDADD